MPPPTRRYATPASEFGIAKPVESWFDFAASGTPRTGPAFSTALSEAENRNAQRELERLQLQRQLQSEQAAQEFLANAAGQKPKGLMRMLSESPEILTSEAAPAIQEYVVSRQQQQAERKAAKQPFSNQILGPAILKSLPPLEQARLSRRMKETGKSIVDVLEEDEQEQMMASERAKIQAKRIELLSKGADPRLVAEAESTESPFESLAIVEGQMSRGGKGGANVDLFDRLERAEKMLQAAMERNPDGGGTVDRLAAIRDSILAEIEGGQPVDGLTLPQAVGSTASERVAAPFAMATAPNLGAAGQIAGIAGGIVPRMDLQPVAPTAPAPLPGIQAAALSPFEQRMQEQNQASMEWREKLNRDWTEAKERPLQSAMQDMSAKPERVVSLAQKAMLGEPMPDATQQERDFATKVAQYALRASKDEPVVIGERAGADMFGVQLPAYQTVSPGYAFLVDIGKNPEEKINIPGASFWGTDKTVTAAELMDLRLKEIAQPMQQAQKVARQQQQSAQLSEKVKKGLDALEGSGNTPK